MKRSAFLLYGVVCYAIFLVTFCYAIGFVGNIVVPKSIDAARTLPLGEALLIDFALLGLFGLQHSGMARPAFKRWLTRFLPQPMERSTYVLLSSLALSLLFWQWQPLGGTVWQVESALAGKVLHVVCAGGWLLVLVSTFLINHFDLFGLRQSWFAFRGQPYVPVHFVTPLPYRHIRHPLYLGFLLAFWSTPLMTWTHLFFALVTTAYVLVAIQLEERDLVAEHPDYVQYRRRVPMLIPRFWRRANTAQPAQPVQTA